MTSPKPEPLPLITPSKYSTIRRALNRAIRYGILKRPEKCSSCGRSGKTKDGRAFIQAHHHRGLENPMDVVWLCPKCHRAVEPHQSRGETNPNATLTAAQVEEIRRTFRKARGASTAFAEKYGVKKGTIDSIVSGRTWKNVR